MQPPAFLPSNMQYCRLNKTRLKKLEEVIDEYLFSKNLFSSSTPPMAQPFASEMNLSSEFLNIK
jgi:hypothetical protein